MLLQLLKPKDTSSQAFHHLRSRLAHHHRRAVSQLHATHAHVAHLAAKHGIEVHKLREHAHRAAATAILSTSLMAAVPAVDLAKQHLPAVKAAPAQTQETQRKFTVSATTIKQLPSKPFSAALSGVVGDHPNQNWSGGQEAQVSSLIQQYYGVKASAQLDGKRLNVVYGLIGGEQHLKRYPGDTIGAHANNVDTRPQLAGMAPGLGGWGYFAPSKAAFDKDAYEREKFYIAAQVFAAPGWRDNVRAMSQWFRFRKMIVINPLTGQGCIVDIGDAGPGLSTHKNFGGSPEVMDAVGWSRGSRKGPVLVYFVDDPQNKIPLGHINPGDYLKKKR